MECGVMRRKIFAECLKSWCGSSGRVCLLCTSVLCLCWGWAWASPAPGLKSQRERPQGAPELGGSGITIVGGRWEESFESAEGTKNETSLAPPTHCPQVVSKCPYVKSSAHTALKWLSQCSYCCHSFFAVLGCLEVISPLYQNIHFLEGANLNAFWKDFPGAYGGAVGQSSLSLFNI